jgi:hypothetical protein
MWPYEVSLFILRSDFFTCREILRHGDDGFTSLPKEGVLRIFIALKNPSSSARFEPENSGLNDKHDNHYTTDGDPSAESVYLFVRRNSAIRLFENVFINR